MDSKKVGVIGGGIVGSSIGYRLSELGHTVVVIDRGPFQKSCSSHSFAWINASSKGPPVDYHNLNRMSVEMWPRFATGLGSDVGLNLNGVIHWENTEEGALAARERVELLQSWGYPIQIVGSEFITEKEPTVVHGTVTFGQYASIEGHVEPKRVIDACQARIISNGGVILNECEVTGFIKDAVTSRVLSIQTPKENIDCDVVVLAAGTDTERLAGLLDVYIPLQESPGVVAWTDSQPHSINGVVMAPSSQNPNGEVHIRQLRDGTFQIVNEVRQHANVQEDDSFDAAHSVLAQLTEYFPQLKNATVIPEPTGYRPMPQDRHPIIGFDSKWSNLYTTVTHSGVTLAPLISELVSMEIHTGVRAAQLNNYRPERFQN